MIFSIRTDTKEWKQDRESRNKSTCKQSIYDKGTMNIQQGKNIFLTKRYSGNTGNTGEPHEKKMEYCFTPHTKFNLKWTKDSTLSFRIIKLEENRGMLCSMTCVNTHNLTSVNMSKIMFKVLEMFT